MSSFDYPSIFSEATAMLGAAPRKNGFDIPIAQFLPVHVGVVSAIGVDDFRLFQRTTANTADGWNRVNERQQLRDVIAIGTGQDDRERNPICICCDMMLGARSRTIYGVRPSFCPAPIARTEDESRESEPNRGRPASRLQRRRIASWRCRDKKWGTIISRLDYSTPRDNEGMNHALWSYCDTTSCTSPRPVCQMVSSVARKCWMTSIDMACSRRA
jgi:hypothetical protein